MKRLRYAILAMVLFGAIAASFLAMVLFGSIAASLPAQNPPADDEAERIAANDMAGVVRGNNEFALELYRHVKDEPGNIFFSPYSISTALAMTMAGARGDTERQMAETLQLDIERDRLHAAVGRMIDALNKAGGRGSSTWLSPTRCGASGTTISGANSSRSSGKITAPDSTRSISRAPPKRPGRRSTPGSRDKPTTL